MSTQVVGGSASLAVAASAATATVGVFTVDSSSALAWCVIVGNASLSGAGAIDLQVSPDGTNYLKHCQISTGTGAGTTVTHTTFPRAAPYLRFQASGGTGATYTVTAWVTRIGNTSR